MAKWIKARNPKVWGYARVSTEDQNLGLQIDALERYGVDEILTEKASGKTTHRKKFDLFVNEPLYLQGGDTLVVWKLDRLGRSLTEVVGLIDWLNNRDVKIVSLTDGIDMTTYMGRAMMQMALVFAEMERNFISERTKAGMARAKAEGRVMGPKPKITGNKKRLAKLRAMDAAGKLRDAEGKLIPSRPRIVEILNEADPKARPIASDMTVRRWESDGFPGLDKKEGAADGLE